MKRCETCKHWRDLRFQGIEDQRGECDLINEFTYEDGDTGLLGLHRDDDLSLMTEPDFGCVKHEPQ